jgi:ribosomal protein L18E
MPLFRRIARRGFSNYPFKKEFQVVNVGDLNRFADGETVTAESLAARGLARKKGVAVKILGAGELARKLIVDGPRLSASAREKIVALGGSVKEPVEAKPEAKAARTKKPKAAAKAPVPAEPPHAGAPARPEGRTSAETDEAK